MSDLSQLISRLMEENDDFNELEDGLVKELFEVGRKVLRGILESMDERLMKERTEGLRHLGVRERTVLTRLGVLRIRRRYYRERGGGTRFLLGEALGWEGGLAATPALEARALKMCSESSFRCAADNLSFFLAENIRHTLLHEMVGRRGGEAACAKQSVACDLFESGALPASAGRRAERLFMEADGCVISLQREQRRKHELKAGISYEGREQVGRDKWRLARKRSFLSAAPADDFLAAWSADLATVYDYRGVSEAVWSPVGRPGWLGGRTSSPSPWPSWTASTSPGPSGGPWGQTPRSPALSLWRGRAREMQWWGLWRNALPAPWTPRGGSASRRPSPCSRGPPPALRTGA